MASLWCYDVDFHVQRLSDDSIKRRQQCMLLMITGIAILGFQMNCFHFAAIKLDGMHLHEGVFSNILCFKIFFNCSIQFIHLGNFFPVLKTFYFQLNIEYFVCKLTRHAFLCFHNIYSYRYRCTTYLINMLARHILTLL